MKKSVLVALCAFTVSGLMGSNLYASHHETSDHHAVGENNVKSQSITVKQTGSFELDIPPAKALPLFTGPGEEVWIPKTMWNPVYLNGDGYEKGTVFLTGNTHWFVTDYDSDKKYARYIRVNQGVDMGSVEVQVLDNGKGGSKVVVDYQLTGLSEKGSKRLQKNFSDSAYANMMKEWKNMILYSKESVEKFISKY